MRHVTMISLLAILAAPVVAAQPTQREISGTELIVQAKLEEMDAPVADVSYQSSAKLAAAFPGYLFVLAEFESVAPEDLPSPFQPRSLFVVPPDGTAILLATPADLLELFKAAFKPIKSAEDAKKAAEAALALEQAKFPEQPFATKPDDLKATPDGKGGFQASANCDPTPPAAGAPNGSGPISVELSIGAMGQPANITTINNYKSPARRNRQVTPADIAADKPAAEKAAGGPVTNINSPTINQALPGSTVFLSQPKPGNNPIVVVVSPSGQSQVLPNVRKLYATLVKATKPLPTTAQQMITAQKGFVPTLSLMYPNYKFDPLQDSDITTVTPGKHGGNDIVGKVYVTGSNKKKWFSMVWDTYPKGQPAAWGFWPHGI